MLAQADSCNLPVPYESVPVMVGMFFHTDLGDFAAAAGSSLPPGIREAS